jgi:hypothetical protein
MDCVSPPECALLAAVREQLAIRATDKAQSVLPKNKVSTNIVDNTSEQSFNQVVSV